MEVEEPQKMGKPREHLSCELDVRWDGKGRGMHPTTYLCTINLRVSFIPFKSSTVNFMSVWGPF